MKRAINILSLAGLLFGAALSLYLLRPVTAASAALNGFPLNEPRHISFSVNKEKLDGKTRRQTLDQMRDWLLYTVVSESGRTTREIGEILYDLPATRDDLMHHVGNFEYGETRSRLIGDNELAALVPVANAQTRIDQLAHIADEHRKNTGEIPKKVDVFEYDLDAEDFSGRITRVGAVTGNELFTEKYGYLESEIRNLQDLTNFMGRVDDIVFASRAGAALKVGGRKIQGYQYLGIRPEEVAAIWQSENNIRLGKGSSAGNVDGSGFSLDPAYDMAKLEEVFNKVLLPLSEMATFEEEPAYLSQLERFRFPNLNSLSQHSVAPSASQVKAALKDCDEEPFFAWISDFRTNHPELVAKLETRLTEDPHKPVSLEEALSHDYGFQKARYDGDLQGTEAGMILFYTDLTAKLWDFDYKESTPREISDFRSKLKIAQQLSPIYLKQIEEAPYSRLWFGPDTRGYQSLSGGQSLVFAHRATRLFAKSKDTQRNEKEVEPNAATAPFINWWDDHYEEVARYEPQYERLNQIMKWSLVISWLNQANKGQQLEFLKDVTVVRSNRFPEWAKNRPDLRFNKWSADMFLPANTRCATTEALPRLSSANFTFLGAKGTWIITGGVSLSSEKVFAERTLLSSESRVANLARRSNLDYAPLKSAENSLQTIEGASYRFQNLAENRIAISSTPKSGAMVRSTYGDFAPSKFEHVVSKDASLVRIQSRYADTGIGDLTIQPRTNGFEVGWQSREVDLSQSLGRRLSMSANPGEVFAKTPDVTAAIKLPNSEGYLVKIGESEKWTRFKPEGEASAEIGAGWDARVADVQASAKPMKVAWLDQAGVTSEFGDSGYLVVRTSKDKNVVMELASELPTSTGKQITILSGDKKIAAVVDSNTESVFVRYGDLPESLQKNPATLQRTFQATKIPNDGVVRLRGIGPLDDIVTNRHYADAVKQLAENPAEFKATLDRNLTDALKRSDELLANRDYDSLQRNLDGLIDLYGPKPELVIRRGVAQIEQGRLRAGFKSFNESLADGQVPERATFFEEINQRLRSANSANGGVVQFGNKGPDVALHYNVSTLPVGKRMSPDAIDFDSGVFYVEDSPGLNSLDWSSSIKSTVNQGLSGELLDVIKLPKGSLSQYRPTEIFARDTGKVFRSPRQTATKYGLHVSIAPGGTRCDSDENDSDECGDVYLIVPRIRFY